jgi:hypothetical protein
VAPEWYLLGGHRDVFLGFVFLLLLFDVALEEVPVLLILPFDVVEVWGSAGRQCKHPGPGGDEAS